MSKPHLKPLNEQIIVLTGGTSGIGLTTARLLARRGAALFLIARNEGALRSVCEEIVRSGGKADFAVADVADRDALEEAAGKAVRTFGRFDSWINDAGAFIYGRLDEVSLADQRRLFDVTYWGMVHGTLVAAERLRRTGGAIVNVGSVLGEFAIPYQGAYCAAKFAIKGFTEAFRRETLARREPISITLIKPAAVNTPYTDHARNALGSVGTRNPPPAYDPILVARAIAHACAHPVRDLTIGGAGGVALVVANLVAPRLVDAIAARVGRTTMTSSTPNDPTQRDNLYEPRADLSQNSSLRPMTRGTSLALEAQLHPGAVLTGFSAALAVVLGARALRR
jgi:short-subunit dehydrogenase